MVKQYKALQLRYPKTKVETGEKGMQTGAKKNIQLQDQMEKP